MSNANQVSLAFVEELTFGETPSGPPTLVELPFTSEDLAFESQDTESRTIRPDRQVRDVVRTSISAGGSLNAELSAGDFDEFMAASLQDSAWSAAITDTDIVYSMANADNSLNRSSGDFVADGYTAGSWIKIAGFSGSTNVGFFKIVSVATLKIVLSGQIVADEAAGPTVTLTQGGEIVNGSALRSFSIEREYTDLASTFAAFRGMAIDTMSLSASSEDILELSFGFLGKDMQSNAATVGDGSNTPASSNQSFNAVDHVVGFYVQGAEFDVTNLSLEVQNGLRGRRFIGTLGNKSVGSGRFRVNGSFTTLMNKAVVDQFIANTETNFALVLQDGAGKSYVFDIPAARYTAAPATASGEDTDVVVEVSFSAFADATEDIMLRIARWS